LAAEARHSLNRPTEGLNYSGRGVKPAVTEPAQSREETNLEREVSPSAESGSITRPLARVAQESADMHLPYSMDDFAVERAPCPQDASDSYNYHLTNLDYQQPQPYEIEPPNRKRTPSEEIADSYFYNRASLPVAAKLTKLFRDSASSSDATSGNS
jgi:hypothetical protein